MNELAVNMTIHWRICLQIEEWALFQAPRALARRRLRDPVWRKRLSGRDCLFFYLFLDLQNAHAL